MVEEVKEEAMEEVPKEAHMEEVDNMEGTSLKQQLLVILDTRLKEDTNPPRTQETTLRRPNKPIHPLQDLLHMVAAYSATAAAPRRLFSSASTTLASEESFAAASTMSKTSRI